MSYGLLANVPRRFAVCCCARGENILREEGIDLKPRKKCGAHARSTGAPCKAKALPNGRCKLHGGLSTGPKTKQGRLAVGAATKARMAAGQLQKAMAGRERWLDTGGRERLSRKAKQRAARLKWMRMASLIHA